MVNRRGVAVAIVLSLVLGMVPRPTFAAEAEVARTQPSINLRASADAAAARLASEIPQARQSEARHAAAGGGQMMGGGGGGKGMMIMTLVMTVVGVGATYYM